MRFLWKPGCVARRLRGFEGLNILQQARLYVCPVCSQPSYFDPAGNQYPGPLPGKAVEGLTDRGLLTLYEEARRAAAAKATTPLVLACRKLLMHLAVTKGAKPGAPFAEYVEYLGKNGFVPPDARPWIDHIRKHGNEANHDIVLASEDSALELLTFCEMLLRIIFEFPAKVAKRTQKSIN